MNKKLAAGAMILLSSLFLLFLAPKVFLSAGVIIAAGLGRFSQADSFSLGRLLGNATVNIVLFGLFIYLFIRAIKMIKANKKEVVKVVIGLLLLPSLFFSGLEVYESLTKVEIKLSCIHKDGFLEIKVENSYDPDAVTNKGEGIGLRNIRDRLRILYHRGNLLSVESENSLFTVKILIPTE